MPTNIFQRLQGPAAVSDIYDKVAQLSAQDALKSPSTSTTTTVANTTVIDITGASGQASGPQYAFVPNLSLVPSNNPAQGAPYSVDGLLIQVNDQFWRYSGSPVYQWQLAGSATAILVDTHANRVTNYPAAMYPDALFLESDTLLLLQSNSLIWRTIAGTVQDTHANRLTNWPSVQFSTGTVFAETDRTAKYVVANAAGTVNTTVSGTTYTVTWQTGNHFINTGTGFTAAQWPAGTPIVINGVAYTVKAISSNTSLTLNSSAGVQTAVNYSVASGRWVYQSGQYCAALGSVPTDLGENDTTLISSEVAYGFLFFENATYFHQVQWNVSAWQRGPEDLDRADTFVMFGAAPSEPGWNVCDGSTQNFFNYANPSSPGSRVLPNLASGAYAKAAGSYSATVTAAALPTFAGVASGSTNVLNTGGVTAVVPGPFTPAGTISLAGGDPVANWSPLMYYRL